MTPDDFTKTLVALFPLRLPGGQGKHAADLRASRAAQAELSLQESAEAGTIYHDQ